MSGPARTVFNPSKIMLVNSWGEDVVFYDLKTLTETSRFALSPNPHEVRYDPKRALVYVTIPYKDGFYDVHKEAAHHIGVVDPNAERLVEVLDLSPEIGPHGMYIDDASDTLWLTVETGEGGVVAYDLENRQITKRISAGITDGKPHWMTMSDTGIIYTANKESRFVSGIDTTEGILKGRIPVPGGSEDVELNADGSLLFISSREDRVLHVVDTDTLDEVEQIEMRERPGRLNLTTTGQLVVTHFNVRLPNGKFLQGLMSVVDPVDLKVVHFMAVGRAPHDLTTTADGKLAYIAHGHSGTLFEVDLETINIKRVIEVGVGTHGVLLLP